MFWSVFLINTIFTQKETLKRIYISVTNDLSFDQRVDKVARTIIKYYPDTEVTLIGRKLPDSIPLDKRPYKAVRLRILFNKGPLFYAFYNIQLLIFLIIKKPAILLANDLDTLPANFLASRILRKEIIYDSHELFTELPELENRKWVKKCWIVLEKIFLPRLKHTYTVCDSIADYYNKKYDLEMKVVRNMPFQKEIPATVHSDDKNIILYQGSVNVKRGLEEIIQSMQYLDHCILLIIGKGDIESELKILSKRLNISSRVLFQGPVPHAELHSYTIKAKLGISLEQQAGLNYYYALPNKLFDYIQAELPVLASDFPEMSKIVNGYNIGITTNEKDPVKLARIVNEMLFNRQKRKFWSENLKQAKAELCWEKEENNLLEVLMHTTLSSKQ